MNGLSGWTVFLQIMAALVGGGLCSLVYEIWRDRRNAASEAEKNRNLKLLLLAEIQQNMWMFDDVEQILKWQVRPTVNHFYEASRHLLHLFDPPTAMSINSFYFALQIHESSSLLMMKVLDLVASGEAERAQNMIDSLTRKFDIDAEGILRLGRQILERAGMRYYPKSGNKQ